MKTAHRYIDELKEELPKLLGQNYVVTAGMYYDQLTPDLAIENIKTHEKTAIELRGLNLHDELPIATIPTVRSWRAALQPQYANFIVLSLSNVPQMVREFLEKDSIGIIQLDGTKKYIHALTGMLMRSTV